MERVIGKHMHMRLNCQHNNEGEIGCTWVDLPKTNQTKHLCSQTKTKSALSSLVWMWSNFLVLLKHTLPSIMHRSNSLWATDLCIFLMGIKMRENRTEIRLHSPIWYCYDKDKGNKSMLSLVSNPKERHTLSRWQINQYRCKVSAEVMEYAPCETQR